MKLARGRKKGLPHVFGMREVGEDQNNKQVFLAVFDHVQVA